MNNSLLFQWQAVNREGKYCHGELLVRNRQQLLDTLQSGGLVPVQIRKKKTYSARSWRGKERVLMFSQLSTLLQAGLPLSDGLALLANGHPIKAWKSVLIQLQQQILSGMAFSAALQRWPEIFPPLCIALVNAGEHTGKLEQCCQKLAHQQQRQLQLKTQLTKALRYPLFVLLLTLLISAAMLLWVLPEFAAIYRSSDTPLPAFTRQLIYLSESLSSIMPGFAATVLVAVLLWRKIYRNHPRWQKSGQYFLLRLPLAGALWQTAVLAQLFSVLALTQQAGLPLREGLTIAGKLQTGIFWQQALESLRRHIEQGQPLSSGLQQHPGFPPLCYLLTHLGEQTGTPDIVFGRLAEWYENTAQQKTADLTASIEPIMLLITGLITGGIVIAIYLPMFSLGDALL